MLSIDSGYESNYSRSFTRGLDDELAAHDYVLLVRHGHSAPRSRQRLIEAIAPRAVLPQPESFAVPGDRAAVAGAVRAFRAAHPEVTAVAAFDDYVALRILAALGDLGLSAPGDLAVIGFDDTDYGVLFTPALTTVHIDAEDHGRRAARVILGLDGDGFIAAPAQVIARESA